jgi:hypothetical protein
MDDTISMSNEMHAWRIEHDGHAVENERLALSHHRNRPNP